MREKYNGCVKTFPNGQMVSERLCKNKNKEVWNVKSRKQNLIKGGFNRCKSKQKTIIAPLIRNRKSYKNSANFWYGRKYLKMCKRDLPFCEISYYIERLENN